MSFLYPYVLIALVLPLLLAGAAIALRHRSGKAWKKLVSPAHKEELVHTPPFWRTVVPPALAFLAMVFAILAAARPINGYSEAGAVATSRNLIIALDVSRSMETRDVSPSRLDQAKAAAIELVQALPTDKIGLIVFSGEADMVVPLTYDHNALIDTINQVDRTWVEYGGTNISLVLQQAMQDFKRSAPDGTNAVVILSDGEETEDESLKAVAKNATKRNLLVIAVGVGTTTGDTIPDPHEENGMWKDASGKHVISKLQPKTLHKLAELTGGDFVLMNSGTDLTDFARHAADKIDRHEEEASINKVPNDLFATFAAAALVLLVAAILLATDWRMPKRAVAGLLLMAAGVLSAPQARAEGTDPAKTGTDDAYEEEDAQATAGMSYAQHYAAGLEYLKAKKIDKAKEAFSRALLSENPALQAAALYALGNLNTQATFSKLRDLYTPKAQEGEEGEEDGAEEEALIGVSPAELQDIAAQLKKDLKTYQEALELNPGLQEARTNIQKVQGLIGALDKEAKRMQEELERQEQEKNEQEQQKKEQQGQQQQQNQQQQQGQQQQQNQQQQQGQQQQQNQQQQQGQQQQQNQQQQQGQQQQQNQQQQQGQQQQQNQQQQQGQQGKQDRQKDKKDGKQQDKKDQKQQQDNQQNDGKDDQQEGQQQKKNKLEDFINSLKDEIDRMKQQQQQKRTPQQQKEDAQDLIDKLKDELEKLKQDPRNQEGQEGKEKKDSKGKEKEDRDGERKDKDSDNGKGDPRKDKEDMDKAMDLARQMEKELQKMRDEAERKGKEDASPEEKKELDEAEKTIRNLKDQIRKLKLAQKDQQKQEEEKDGAPALSPEKEKEKAEQRAEGALRMSLDEETGSPIPSTESRGLRYGDRNRRPRKDY